MHVIKLIGIRVRSCQRKIFYLETNIEDGFAHLKGHVRQACSQGGELINFKKIENC